jgi:hypothetical protein
VSGVVGKKVRLGQENGVEVDLVVSGTRDYATYETPDGFPAVYDLTLGLFCYALVVDGEYQSTGVGVTSSPPSNVHQHAKESDEVRAAKIRSRQSLLERQSQGMRETE